VEFTEPERIRLQRLLRLNSILKKIFVVILFVLCIFVLKHALLAIISVGKAGVRLDSVADIIKHHFLAFFNSFGDLTSKYMLFVSLLLFINVVGITANKLWKIFRTRAFFIILFFLSIIITFNLPIEKVYAYFSKTGKTGLIVFCLVMMIPGPHILGRYLAKEEITSLILSKVFYIIIYGLLLIQLFIEW